MLKLINANFHTYLKITLSQICYDISYNYYKKNTPYDLKDFKGHRNIENLYEILY